MAREVDLAVHSLKDVPTALPQGLRLCAVLEREDPRDAVLSLAGLGLKKLNAGARVGTTSLRRRAHVGAAPRPRARGPARQRRHADPPAARGGLRRDPARDGRAGAPRARSEAAETLEPGVHARSRAGGDRARVPAGDTAVRRPRPPLHDPPTARGVAAERALLAGLHGGCNVPMGAYAEGNGGTCGSGASSPSRTARAWCAPTWKGTTRRTSAASWRSSCSNGAGPGCPRDEPRGRRCADPERPLAGRRVLVTRSAGSPPALVERLRARGAEVVSFPWWGSPPPTIRGRCRSPPVARRRRLAPAHERERGPRGGGRRHGRRGPCRRRAPGVGGPRDDRGHPFPSSRTGDRGRGHRRLRRRRPGPGARPVNVAGSRMVFPVSDRSPAELADPARPRSEGRSRGGLSHDFPEGSEERLRAALEAASTP